MEVSHQIQATTTQHKEQDEFTLTQNSAYICIIHGGNTPTVAHCVTAISDPIYSLPWGENVQPGAQLELHARDMSGSSTEPDYI